MNYALQRRLPQLIVLAVVASFFTSGCVGKKKYDAVVRDRENLKVEMAKHKKQAASTEADLEAKIEALGDRIDQLEKKVAGLQQQKTDVETKLEEARGTIQMYESKHGSLEDRLKTTKDQLAQLREQQRKQEERLERYRKLAKRLADTFESGELSVKVRDGKMVIEMSDNVLFNSGQAKLNEGGEKVLQQLADVLQDISDREFLIAGHTDDVPINSSRFKDNWDLSTGRATNVVRFLAKKGVSPKSLAAAGYSKYDPIAPNKTKKGKSKNRRIEIILMPKLDELPNLPKDIVSSK